MAGRPACAGLDGNGGRSPLARAPRREAAQRGPSVIHLGIGIGSFQLVAGGRSNRGVDRAARATPPAPPAEKLAGWKELAEDTRINETVRRRLTHEKLAGGGRVEPQDITKWLYKEVLKADLDDPHLGLGDILNRQYPFAAEDSALKLKK